MKIEAGGIQIGTRHVTSQAGTTRTLTTAAP